MKVDIAIPNLEVSGTLKYVAGLASGFKALGHQVRLLYAGEGPDWQLLDSILGSISRERYAGTASQTLSRWFETPIIRIFADGTFVPDQSVNIIGSLLRGRRARWLMSNSDLVIYSNFWAYPPDNLLHEGGPREVLIFHEGIESSFLPWMLRRPLQAYIRKIARRVDLSMAITSVTARRLNSQGVATIPIYDGFWTNYVSEPKERLVIADSRWTKDRQPRRLVRIAQQVPRAKFVMVGRFPNPSVRDGVVHDIEAAGLNDRVHIAGPLTERELLALYARAMLMIRWAMPGTEIGFTYSLVQAISAGSIPILSSGLGGAEHLAQEVSHDLVARSDSEFAQILNRLINDERYYSEMLERVLAWRNRRPWTVVAREVLDEVW